MSNPPIFDASKTPRARREIKRPAWAALISGKAGEKAIEHRPITKSIQAVNGNGHVVWVPLYTGPAQVEEENVYRRAIEFAKLKFGSGRSKKPGFIPLGQCPQSYSRLYTSLPEAIRGRQPCRTGANGGEVSDADPCECVLATIKERAARNRAEQAEQNAALKSPEERTAEKHVEAMNAARDATDAANRLASQVKPSK